MSTARISSRPPLSTLPLVPSRDGSEASPDPVPRLSRTRGTAAETVIRMLTQHPQFGGGSGFHFLSGNTGSNEGPTWQAIEAITGFKGTIHGANEFLAACMASGFEALGNATGQGVTKIPVLALHAQAGVKYAAAGFDFLARQRQPCLLLVGDAGMLARQYGGHNSVADYSGLLRALGVKSVHFPMDDHGMWSDSPERLLPAVRDAMTAVMTEPYGLVALILDEDLMNLKVALPPIPVAIPQPKGLPLLGGGANTIDAGILQAAELLKDKTRPVMVLNQEVGRSQGGRKAAEELATLIGARVVACYAPASLFDREHEGWCGHVTFGDANDVEQQIASYDPDVVIVVGGPFPNNVWPNGRSGVPEGVPAIVISPDPTDEKRCNIHASAFVCANTGLALTDLLSLVNLRRTVSQQQAAKARLQEIANENRARLEARVADYEQHMDDLPIHPARIAKELMTALKTRAEARRLSLQDVALFDEALTSSQPFQDYVEYLRLHDLFYYGTPGPTLGAHGASLGFQAARPNSLVISLFGDGGADFNEGAFIVAARENLPVKHLLIDNGGYELVSLNFTRDARLRGETEQGQFEAGCVQPLHTQRLVHQHRAFQVRGFVHRGSQESVFDSAYVELPDQVGQAIGAMLDSTKPFLLQVIAQGPHFQPKPTR